MKWLAWEAKDSRGERICIGLGEHVDAAGLTPGDLIYLLYTIEADTWEEACQEHHRRQGWEPYRPMESKEPGSPLIRRKRHRGRPHDG